MEVTIRGSENEIAALVLAIQERRSVDKYVMVREPYSQRYVLVKTGAGEEKKGR